MVFEYFISIDITYCTFILFSTSNPSNEENTVRDASYSVEISGLQGMGDIELMTVP
eukprot:UN09755